VPDPGTWGNFVRVDVDYDSTDPLTLFNLTVSEVSPAGNQPFCAPRPSAISR
jgi:hypothetical protein